MENNVFDYIKNNETAFQTGIGVPIVDGWDFDMYNHIRKSTLYKFGQLANRTKTDNDPVINIILPILNVAYRVENIDVKDIVPYVDDPDNQHKSLFVKKFHDRWARREEFEMDEFLDDLQESKTDFGLVLVKKGSGYPEVVPLQRLAFCDQTDILSGPICEKHSYTVDQLLEMKGKWDSDAIDDLIVLAQTEKPQQQVKGKKQDTPGKYIEVYELHGMLPDSWLDGDPDVYTRQIHIISYYQSEDINDKGITLYSGPEKESIYEAHKRDKIYGRACGLGGVEELFEPQVWHTYSAIQKKEMLDTAALMIVKTTDGGLAKRQRITDLRKGEMLELQDGTDASQLVLQPINWGVFDDWQNDMKLTAQTQGSANDPTLGVEPKSGTPFALQKMTTVQGMGIHEYRQGKMITFVSKLYRKWFLKQIVAEMNKGDEWMEELSLDEMKDIAEKISNKEVNSKIKKLILSGKLVSPEEIEVFRVQFKELWMKGGNKRFFKLIKDEMKDIAVDVKINIKNKQKNLIEEADKIISFMRAIIASPVLLENEGFADLMNQVIEKYGLNPVDFKGIGSLAPQTAPQTSPQPAQAPLSPVAQ
ncbi:MAG: hypothetical protein U9O65_10605 [Thermotogota bacterium]|nr:hypothetical protein [Thermotogota bacterium]